MINYVYRSVIRDGNIKPDTNSNRNRLEFFKFELPEIDPKLSEFIYM